MNEKMNKKYKMEAIVAFAVTLAFVMPGAAFANDEEPTNNSEIYSGLCPLLCYDAEHTDITLDTLNLGVLGDRFYAYNAFDPSGVLPEGPVYFDSELPGTITSLAPTTSSEFIAGATWARDTWYGCQYNNGWLWTIDKVTGDMTLIGGGNTGLNGLAYDLTTDKMYGGSSYNLYTINMSNGKQALVGSFNTGGLMIAIAFDNEGNLYGVDLGTGSLYSINILTGATTLIGSLGIDLNYAQDAAYDKDNDILYLSAYVVSPVSGGHLYTCNVTTGACTLVGKFQSGAEITGFAIPYTSSPPPETPERPDGPTEGIIEVEYTFSTSTTDPEGEQVYYMWDWDDGTVSDWIGPYDSGANAQANHSWAEVETYDIKVKAKDIRYAESNWSDPKTIHIMETAILEIGNITGSLFKVSTVIRNIGGVDATTVSWSITLNGGIILSGENSGNILNLPAGGETTISSSLIFGFGKTVITATAECAESSDTSERDAFVFLFFIL